jgi:hypothetical protein
MNMRDDDLNSGIDNMMEAYYKLIGEAHVKNLLEDLESDKDEIDQVQISKSLDDWFEGFINKREKEKQRKKWLKRIRTYSGRAAMFILVLIGVFTAVTMSVEAFRIRILNYFMEKTESYTEFKVDEVLDDQNAPKLDLDQYYYLTYLPEGYTYDSHQIVGEVVMLRYSNGTDIIIFTQGITGSAYHLDTEDAEMKEVPIRNSSGYLIVKDDVSILFWNEKNMDFMINGNLEANELIKIAEGLEKNK